MRGKFIVNKEDKIALIIVQILPTKGVISAYNQVLLNALICAFFTIYDKSDLAVEEFEIGYEGWISESYYVDFSTSNVIKEYMKNNPEVWFCKIISDQLGSGENN